MDFYVHNLKLSQDGLNCIGFINADWGRLKMMKERHFIDELIIDGRPIHGVLFDMDGTLLDSGGAVASSWKRWSERTGVSFMAIMEYSHGRPARDTIQFFAPNRDFEVELQWLLSYEMKDDEGIAPIPGIHAFLQRLRLPWTIVTSASAHLARHRLHVADLPIPDRIVTVEDVRRGKPDPEGYLLGAEALGVPIENCVVIEDSPIGIEAGTRAGAQVIAITTTFPAGRFAKNYIIRDYHELLRVL
ncbi:MAG: hypothetical protein C5B49_11325 [Bdellovibrio sp.]|nr:MAG: hypothetical protein C5B49_11325 [Bdellovibrio sp.]